MQTKKHSGNKEQGVILLTLLTLLIPLLLAAGAFTAAMSGRSSELLMTVDRERALLAAEAGIDDAIHRSRLGTLVSGTAYNRNLGSGMVYDVVPKYLGNDLDDNDIDGLTDEADEDMFRVISTGTYRNTRRRVAAYLGPVPLLPPITTPVALASPTLSIELTGTVGISGVNTNINGSTPSVVPLAAPQVPPLSVFAPNSPASLTAELSPSEMGMLSGATPLVGTTAAINVPSLVSQVQNAANNVLTSNKYSALSFGNANATLPTAYITYREGDVSFAGNTTGAGILAVTGDLTLKGNFRFDGVIIVLGNIVNAAGTAQVYGGIIQGPAATKLEMKGTMNVYYSSEAINLANSTSGRYVAFSGWQELSR